MPRKKKSKLSAAMLARIKKNQQLKREMAKDDKSNVEEEISLEEPELIQEDKPKPAKKKRKSAAQKKRDAALARRREALLKQMNGSQKKTITTSVSAPPVEKKIEKLDIQEDMRSPICCVLGHVDTGKTKILDYIRKTNVQNKEVGGITQQIGASYFPIEDIRRRTMKISGKLDIDYKLPGLLIIDTPGHDTFTNLRERGTSLCDVAILVVDIMHGVEQQTIESIGILKKAQVPFVIALNKIDRLVDWKETKDEYIETTLTKQNKKTLDHFEERVKDIKYILAQYSVNALLYYKNQKKKKILSMVPVSAHTGEGIPDLLALIMFLTQKWMSKSLTLVGKLSCSVMEVKTERGIGTTIDVILSNGVLRVNDKIILATLNGTVTTSIRGLLTPKPLCELRVKGDYIHHKEIKASMGVKIIGNDLENVIAGTSLYKITERDTEESINKKKELAMQHVDEVLESLATNSSKTHDGGVYVKASTLGSLEALVKLLKSSDIPISLVGIGDLTKRDIIKTCALRDENEYSHDPCIVAFNLNSKPDIEKMAEKEGIKVFKGEIVYNLVDMYKKYLETCKKEIEDDHTELNIYPCKLEILPQFVFAKRNPLIFGVKLLEGQLKIGTPIIIPEKNISLGNIVSIQKNNKELRRQIKIGEEVCVRIEESSSSSVDKPKHYMYGRQFDEKDILYSNINRASIDFMKKYHKDDLSKKDWLLVLKLKQLLEIL